VAASVKAFFERYRWNLALALVMSALKHSGFEEEKEWRLVSQYPDEALSTECHSAQAASESRRTLNCRSIRKKTRVG
jgi:hypothetical protein